jgi:3-hydroxymyristoyl/3-hydroxydecanoyl-(acyl carrier protein) dehydratase
VRKVKIGNFVLPGDKVITKISLKQKHEKNFILQFHNSVDNKKVCVAEAEFGIR